MSRKNLHEYQVEWKAKTSGGVIEPIAHKHKQTESGEGNLTVVTDYAQGSSPKKGDSVSCQLFPSSSTN